MLVHSELPSILFVGTLNLISPEKYFPASLSDLILHHGSALSPSCPPINHWRFPVCYIIFRVLSCRKATSSNVWLIFILNLTEPSATPPPFIAPIFHPQQVFQLIRSLDNSSLTCLSILSQRAEWIRKLHYSK